MTWCLCIFARPYRSKLPSEAKTTPECCCEHQPANPPPLLGVHFWSILRADCAFFPEFVFFVIFTDFPFLHDPIEYDATGRPTTTAIFSKKVDAHSRNLEQFGAHSHVLEQFSATRRYQCGLAFFRFLFLLFFCSFLKRF